uniref:Large ribosomal subunit protein uL2c n=1 Tax=Cyanidium caldarium TaxID=2771 RepID=RK2_CYACA|nr:ribosomal protein L2 [Cyanidium caldarium]Q9TLT5.1 RecName: Full=Large ribosomal subunit protein uL2c; AltName: Full=50S ribosomal protein L2, chloroplastic [Cyanidium caldarium]AAF12910.1 unknown [Cyanidium caldarium]WDB00309.1 ribosomal protein L2 [Cyanidium caldarium]
MAIKKYKPYTPSMRGRVLASDFFDLSEKKAPKRLSFGIKSISGRNNQGKITCRHKGGGHKRKYRLVDFKRCKTGVLAKVSDIYYDPNRSAHIALLNYLDGEKSYIISPNLLKVGTYVVSGKEASPDIGNALPLNCVPLGFEIHNIELIHGKGGQVARAAGTSAKLIAKSQDYVTIKLPSGEIRLFRGECYATIGKVGNIDHNNEKIGKAGRNRWLGIRPTVRGSAMNAVDHPHGGGEGRSPIGRSQPSTPWGRPALGIKTRRNKFSNFYILRRRK